MPRLRPTPGRAALLLATLALAPSGCLDADPEDPRDVDAAFQPDGSTFNPGTRPPRPGGGAGGSAGGGGTAGAGGQAGGAGTPTGSGSSALAAEEAEAAAEPDAEIGPEQTDGGADERFEEDIEP